MTFKNYRIADLIIDRLSFLGISQAFVVTGGAAMHLNDAIGKASGVSTVYCHHEQACSMAAESYARVSKKPALVNVTAGPGGINALNGVFGAFTDSIPIVVISGQAKRETSLRSNPIDGLRQLGDQEANTIDIVKSMVKYVNYIDDADPEEVLREVDKAFSTAISGRPGPVWLDIPIDVQGTLCEFSDVEHLIKTKLIQLKESVEISDDDIDLIFEAINQSLRPVILAGTGVSISSTEKSLLEFAKLSRIPVCTAWQHDIFPNDHQLFGGRAGTIGTRAGNFVVQNSDLVIILGSRLNLRQISYNYSSFAKNAKKIWVDIDKAEFEKPFVRADEKIHADLREFLPKLVDKAKKTKFISIPQWLGWVAAIRIKYTPQRDDYSLSDHAINAYHFIDELFIQLAEDEVVVCANATATITPYQIGQLKKGMRLISNSGSASMGYELPAAIGVISAGAEKVICLAGDGSIMMNLQELSTIAHHRMNVVIFVLCNDGYLSIKQTQRNFFGRENGSSSQSGLSYPDFEKLGAAFGLKSCRLNKNTWEKDLCSVLSQSGPILCEVPLDLVQEFEPRLKSRFENGKIFTPELDDMYPFLNSDELEAVRCSAIGLVD